MSPNAKLKILLCSLSTKSQNLKPPITTLNITSSYIFKWQDVIKISFLVSFNKASKVFINTGI